MGTASWALPVGILSAIVVVSFGFVWWWFPRAYRRGVKADMDRVDEDRRQRAMAENSEATSMNGDVEANAGAATGDGTMPAAPPPARLPKATTFKYTPQAYTAY